MKQTIILSVKLRETEWLKYRISKKKEKKPDKPET